MSAAPIAIVGLGCWYPDARNPRQLWENILSRRRQFRRIPEGRLSAGDYFDPDPAAPDKAYAYRAAVIDGFEFDWAMRRIPKSTFRSTDVAHWLALETALAAIEDAGYDRASIPGRKTGVIVGNTLTGEQTRSVTLRLRWPYVRKALRVAAARQGMAGARARALEKSLAKVYKSAFPPVNEDTLAGGLSNTIAGRICNYLDLDGGGYTIDGACSSSLLAVATAATRLASGELDLALAGGVDISLDPFELVGFSKTGALTNQEMMVYDRRGSGFIPGEGCGFVVLKRLADVRRDQELVYAVLHGWGISSDGGQSAITAPNVEGQARAIQRAYRGAPFDMQALDFIEGHGTGTAVGDRTELSAIIMAMGNGHKAGANARTVGMTSIKSIIGHTKAASGVAGLIKAVMAVNRRVLPPIAGCDSPHPIFDTHAQALYPIQEGQRLDAQRTVRAGVSAMGFGGINCHLAISSEDPPVAKLGPGIDEEALLASQQRSEIFVLAAESAAALAKKARWLIRLAPTLSLAELADLAAKMGSEIEETAPMRAAIVAHGPDELTERCEQLQTMVAAHGYDPKDGNAICDAGRNVWLGRPTIAPRIGILFPGQGSQNIGMGARLIRRFPWARQMQEMVDDYLVEKGHTPISPLLHPSTERMRDEEALKKLNNRIAATEVAQPAICMQSMIWWRFLRLLGLTPAAVGGHSLGEISAFHCAGAFDLEDLIAFASLRGQAMAATDQGSGAMVSLQCSREKVDKLLKRIDDYLILANINSTSQMVLSGEVSAVEAAMQMAATEGILSRRLQVTHAFHSRMAAEAAEAIATQSLMPETVGNLQYRLFSSTSGDEIVSGAPLRQHLVDQILSQVDFVAMVRAMAQSCDLFVEVGPGRVLSGLVTEISGDGKIVCLPVEGTPDNDQDLNRVLAALFTHGTAITWSRLYENRMIRPFVVPQDKIFISNPCETPLDLPTAPVDAPGKGAAQSLDSLLTQFSDLPPERISAYLKTRGSFLARIIEADLEHEPGSPGRGAQPPAAGGPPDEPSPLQPPTDEDDTTPQDLPGRLLEMVQEVTGYPPESITLESRLLDDLNLDSIKAGDLLSRIAQAYGIAWPGDPAILANATLNQIIAAISKRRSDEVDQRRTETLPPQPHPGRMAGRSALAAMLLDQVEKVTGFARQDLTLDLRLIDDLNLDSIKIGDLVSQLAQQAGVEVVMTSRDLSTTILRDILTLLEEQAAYPPKFPEITRYSETKEILGVILEQTARITGYPLPSLNPDVLVERGLNIGPDLLEAILRKTAAVIGVETRVDLTPLRSRTLRQIAAVFTRIARNEGVAVASGADNPLETLRVWEQTPWVREFGLRYSQTTRPPLPAKWGQRSEDDWQTAKALLIHTPSSQDVAQAMARLLLKQGAQVHQATYGEADARQLVADASHTHLIAILPLDPGRDRLEDIDLEQVVALRTAVMAPPPAAQAPRLRSSVAFIQFGGGYFGHRDPFAYLPQCATHALAASLHHERADLRVRVLDFSPALAPEKIAAASIAEIITPQPFASAGYDFNMVRRSSQVHLLQPETYTPRSQGWTDKDLILVTGGAKGITAACALAVARATGCRMALLGRTPHPDAKPSASDGDAVAATLERYRRKGLNAEYFCCDVANADSVAATIGLIQKEMGPITGVVHGAGLNRPRLAASVSREAALAEILPKVGGLIHIFNTLKDNPPRLVVALSSVIATTGMPGNAWYGFSNEAMEILMRRFGADHKGVETLSVVYSIWREEGMGARLGSVSQLEQKGIFAIPTGEGVARFVRLFLNHPGVQRVVVSARLAGLDTWNLKMPLMPVATRYIDTPIAVTPGVESVFGVHLSLEKDPYLKDHRFQGSYLFPTVFGLEAMAQVAAHASGVSSFERVRIEGIRLERPITVDPQTGSQIIIRAVVAEKGAPSDPVTVKTAILKAGTGIHRDYFSATFVLGMPSARSMVEIGRPATPTAIEPDPDLYRDSLLFQGPLFQRLGKIWSIHSEEPYRGTAIFETRREAAEEAARKAFVSPTHQHLLLGDPFFRDSLLQSAALLIPQDRSLPVAIESLEINAREADAGPVLARVTLVDRQENENLFENRVEAVDDQGRILERLTGYRLKMMKHIPEYPTVADLIAPEERDNRIIAAILEKAAQGMALTIPTIHLHHTDEDMRHRDHDLRELARPLLERVVRRAVAGRDHQPGTEQFSLGWHRDNQPYLMDGVDGDLGLFLALDRRHLIVGAGHGRQGCRLAPIVLHSREEWQNRLGLHGRVLLDGLIQGKDTLDQAGSRLMACLELLEDGKSKNASLTEKLTIIDRDGQGVLFKYGHHGESHYILTLPLLLTRGAKSILALMVAKAAPVKTDLPSLAHYHKIYANMLDTPAFDMARGPQDQLVFVQRRPVTFKPSAQMSRTIYFDNYIQWMGELREASVWPIMDRIVPHLATGKWGSVTNYSQIEILGEGRSGDTIEGHLWVSDNGGPEDSTMTLSYDFRKMLPGGGFERLAWCNLQTTWVEIVGPGVARPAPYPDYYQRFMADMLPQKAAPDIPEPMPEPLAGLNQVSGEAPLYTAPRGPMILPLLREMSFETTLSNANMVGNVYYSNYYNWQGQIRDRFFYDLIPEAFRGTGERGELVCLKARVDHLREAMPFDRVVLTMALKELHTTEALFHFDYFREEPGQSRVKLAFGTQRAVWVNRDANGHPQGAPFPRRVMAAFEKKIAQRGS